MNCYFRLVILLFSVPPAISSTESSCKMKVADIVFILDASGSVGSIEYEKSLEFVSDMVKDFEIGEDKVRIGVIEYSSKASVHFNLQKYFSKTDVLQAIKSTPKASGETQTDLALDAARNIVFNPKNGMRSEVPQILILLTDGKSNEPSSTISSAKLLHQKNTIVFTVGVGNADKHELEAIASENRYVYLLADFNGLSQIDDTFFKNICKVMKPIAPTTISTTTPTSTTTATTTTMKTTAAAASNSSTSAATDLTGTTSFIPCDLECFDKSRDCSLLNKKLCSDPSLLQFLTTECELYCGFCKPTARCMPTTTDPGPQDHKLCAALSQDACTEFPDLAKTTCPVKCSQPGVTTSRVTAQVVISTGDTSIGNTTPSVTTHGNTIPGTTTPGVTTHGVTTHGNTTPGMTAPGVTTHGVTTHGNTTPGITTPSDTPQGITTALCIDTRDCSGYKLEYCTSPDYRLFMSRVCRKFCNLC